MALKHSLMLKAQVQQYSADLCRLAYHVPGFGRQTCRIHAPYSTPGCTSSVISPSSTSHIPRNATSKALAAVSV